MGKRWWFGYAVKRLLRMAASLAAVSLITFALLQAAPGNFADIQRLTSGATSLGAQEQQEYVGQIQARYGTDKPAWQQYLIFMRGAVRGDFGPSYKYPTLTVQEIIATAFPVSVTLAVLAVGLAVLLAIPLGVLAAVRQNSVFDYGTMFLATLGRSLPNYLVAIFCILLFSKGLGWLPSSGWTEPKQVILPVLALTVGSLATLARYIRSSMLETLRQEYITAARAKGGGAWAVIYGHALRNSLIPLVTVIGPQLAVLMTGTVFIEAMFGIPGLGLYFADAARSRDMPLLMGATLFFAFVLMVMNLLVDLSYGLLDPRIRYDQMRGAR